MDDVINIQEEQRKVSEHNVTDIYHAVGDDF
jgi:hypothetical protein